jgi:hypothetical protein
MMGYTARLFFNCADASGNSVVFKINVTPPPTVVAVFWLFNEADHYPNHRRDISKL